MLNEFILVSGWAFWIIIVGVIALDTAFLSADDMQPQAVGFTAAAVLLIILFTDAFAGARISAIIAAALAYIVIGVGWSIKKWYSFVVEERKNLRAKYADLGRVNKQTKGNETFESYAADYQPTAAKNKQRITGWMALWPFSLSWWILTWPRRAFVWLYERLSTLFDRISAHVWASS